MQMKTLIKVMVAVGEVAEQQLSVLKCSSPRAINTRRALTHGPPTAILGEMKLFSSVHVNLSHTSLLFQLLHWGYFSLSVSNF